MTHIDSTKVKWQVQVRKSREHKWIAKGTFETRDRARNQAKWLRDWGRPAFGYGFGNTRVVRHISGKGKAP
jgi:transposase